MQSSVRERHLTSNLWPCQSQRTSFGRHLPPLRRQPQFGRAATPTFLFLYIALPVMKQCRDELMDLDLWNPLGQRALNARDNHIAWKKYTEFMPRAQVAMMEIPIYATYSLLSDLDALCERILTAEKRFREGPQKVIHTHRAA